MTHTISSDALKLVTRTGKSYDPSTDAAIATEKSIIFEEIQPDVSKTGTLVYDVPPDAVAGSKLRVEDLFSDAHGFVNLGL